MAEFHIASLCMSERERKRDIKKRERERNVQSL